MIPIAPREKTAFPPGRPLLVPTGPSFLSSSALPALRAPAHGNALKMILLRDKEVKLPGIISLHNANPSMSLAECGNQRNSFSISTLEENGSRKGRMSKPFKMILLCDAKNNLPAMILLRKKVGGTPLRAHSHCQTDHPGRIVVPERTS